MTRFDVATLTTTLKHKLIVSCQARPGEPLNQPAILAAMAQSVAESGASAIRANEPTNIRAIREGVQLPIFGIYKQDYADSPVYITPTVQDAEAIMAAGCDVLTVEATNQPRPNGESLADFFHALRQRFDTPIMADVSTYEEGVRAAELGADFVATTMAGYTPYSRQAPGPDFDLVRDLAATLDIPVIAEGRIATPDDVRQMLTLGAHAVVVGSMITRPGHITDYFVRGMKN